MLKRMLVRVAAVAVNTLVRSGAWHTPVAFPLVVGRDLAGTVAAAGADVSDVRPGDRVWANSAGYGGRPGATAGLVPVARERLYRRGRVDQRPARPASAGRQPRPGHAVHRHRPGPSDRRAGPAPAHTRSHHRPDNPPAMTPQ